MKWLANPASSPCRRCAWLLLVLSCTAQSAANPTLSLVFRNDTADVERFLRTGYARAQDDHLTVSLGARVEGLGKRQALDLAADLHVLTERREGRRADLGLLRAGRRWRAGRLDLRLGVGVLATGALGGEVLQNSYHAASGNAVLDLAYPASNTCDALVEGEASWILWQGGRWGLGVEASALQAAGFHRERAGLGVSLGVSRFLSVEAQAARVGYRGLGEALDNAFDSGPCYGALLALRLPARGPGVEGAELCAFFLANGARQDQSLPGISLRLHPSAHGRTRLSTVGWGP